jgi:UDP-N-acetyl-D-mannosaminuronic acid dehydrogenase
LAPVDAKRGYAHFNLGYRKKFGALGPSTNTIVQPDFDDLRESPALHITQDLIGEGFKVLAVEPNIKSHPELTVVNYLDAIKQADVVVFLVGHKEFKTLQVENGLDFCGILNS